MDEVHKRFHERDMEAVKLPYILDMWVRPRAPGPRRRAQQSVPQWNVQGLFRRQMACKL